MRWLTGTAEAPLERGALAPIRIFTAEIELDGYVAPAGQRITDILLRGQDLAFLPVGADVVPENWISISPGEILLASPPPLPRRSAIRRPPAQRRVSLRVGRYGVAGTAHTEADERTLDQIAARQTFLPLTHAELTRDGDGVERYAVLIVNVAMRRR